jgi:hypothetical protein
MPLSPDTTPIDATPRTKDTRVPPLFARETHLLGWQGLTLTIPENWNLGQFGGTHRKGQIRVDDEDGPRLEISWEQPASGVDIARSVENLLQTLQRDAKKRKSRFVPEEKVRVVSKSRKRKNQLTSFGWTGEREDIAGQGWGVSWQCPDCGRVLVGHLIGRGRERPERVRELAAQVLESLECHGQGGWETWSVFDLRLEVPAEFKLDRARLVTGRLELEWIRPRLPGAMAWSKRDERLALARFSLAASVLQNESLEEWTNRVLRPLDKKRVYGKMSEVAVDGHAGVLAQGILKDIRRRTLFYALDWMMRRARPLTELRAWHCEPSNKLFSLRTELSSANEHIIGDVLDSLQCH